MSAARDEADAGPEVSTNDVGNDPGSGQGDEEQRDHEAIDWRGTRTVSHNEEEASSSIAEELEFDDYVQPDQPTHLGSRIAPGTTERPSSADGSLSIPDDTPSLQVASHGLCAAELC